MEHQFDYGPKPFHLFHSWFYRDGFDVVVEDSWSSVSVVAGSDNPWIIFKKKLQLLKYNLRVWYSNNRDMVATKSRKLQELIESIDSKLMGDDGLVTLREQ